MSARWIVALAVLAVAGCGSEPRLGQRDAGAMHKDVADARTAAAQGDPEAAVRALESLERRIDAADLSPDVAAALKRGAARARRRAAREIAPPQPEATATATPIPTPAPTVAPKGPGKGKAKGHEKKHGEGDKE